jgi:hypothetical protein
VNAVTTHSTMSPTSFARKEVTVDIGCTIPTVGVTKLLAHEGTLALLSCRSGVVVLFRTAAGEVAACGTTNVVPFQNSDSLDVTSGQPTLLQILLVIVLSWVESHRMDNLRDDGLTVASGLAQFFFRS